VSTRRKRAQNLEGDPDQAPVRAAFTATNNELFDASRREALAGAKIIVWPEQGGLTFDRDEAKLLASGQTLAREEHIYLEMAYEVFQPVPSQNKAVLIDPQGRVVWTYEKAHPAPGADPSTPGDGIIPVANTPYGRLANVICLDAFYPGLMQQVGEKGIDVMLVPGLEWPGITDWVPQVTAFRAIEYGYSLVRPATNDISLTVDYEGRTLAATDYFTTDQQVMIASVPTKGVWMIYGLVGDLFSWLCIGGLFVLTGLVVVRSWRKPSSTRSADLQAEPLPLEEPLASAGAR